MEQNYQQVTVSTISEIYQSDNVDDVVLALTSFASMFGFDSVSITQLVSPARAGGKRIAITDWPEDFIEYRLANEGMVRDPIAKEALRSKSPFTWQDVYNRSDKRSRKFLDQAREATSNDGLLIPIHPYDSIPGCVSLGAQSVDLSKSDIGWIDTVCIQAFMKIVELMGPFAFEIRVSLTGREIDVIHYAAAGKTNWEISRILSISEHTVRDYFRSAARKLETIGKTHTVATAIANGLVLI